MSTTTLEQPAAAVVVDDLEYATSVFVTARPRLFKVAYRVLGDVSEAEDVMQDVWLRWQRTDRTVVANPPAFLATMTARLAINVAKSACRMARDLCRPVAPRPGGHQRRSADRGRTRRGGRAGGAPAAGAAVVSRAGRLRAA